MLRAYAQLLRIPNVFTALADVLMGYSIAIHIPLRGFWSSIVSVRDDFGVPCLVWLLLGSACLYSAGMALNDWFDVKEDRRERPHRPIPSGRVSPRAALGLAIYLLGIGYICGIAAHLNNLEIGGALVVSIVLYDGWLKRTPFAPIGMGLCRFLNVLLGFSLLSAPEFDWRYFQFAGIVGLYIVGVTWFARTEAKTSGRVSLILASCVMMAAVVQAISLPISLESRDDLMFYPYLFALWTLIVALPIIEAIRTPEPKKVQAAVKRCIMGLIGLDALLAFAVVGWPGLWILVLLIPAVVLGRWVYST